MAEVVWHPLVRRAVHVLTSIRERKTVAEMHPAEIWATDWMVASAENQRAIARVLRALPDVGAHAVAHALETDLGCRAGEARRARVR